MSTTSRDLIISIVRQARTGSYPDAASGLNQLLQSVSTLLRTGAVDPSLRSKIAYSLETVYMMQQLEDWVGLADVLEYEFIHLIR